MRSTGRSTEKACLSRRRPTTRARPIRHRRPHPITWFRPGRAPTVSPLSFRTARTITCRITSPKVDTADRSQRHPPEASAGLRSRCERTRLALRGGPRTRSQCHRSARPYWEKYNVGGRNERRNIEVVRRICALLDRLRPIGRPYEEFVTFVADRPGHDLRYAIDATKLERELGWRALETFDSGIEKTVRWYLDNEWWWRPLRGKVYAGERWACSPKKCGARPTSRPARRRRRRSGTER